MYTGGKPISNINPDITFFGSRLFNVIPVPVIIYGIMIVITFIIMNYLKFGKGTYAIGGNINAAKTSGIKVKKNIVLIYAYAGLMAGLCAVIFMGRTGGSMQPAAATGIELTAIAAATIGGTSHSGGIGTVWGVVIGALILGVMANGFTLLGINAFIQQIVEGLIIVAAVIFDMRKNKMR
jgi:inositol transport system permease protein